MATAWPTTRRRPGLRPCRSGPWLPPVPREVVAQTDTRASTPASRRRRGRATRPASPYARDQIPSSPVCGKGPMLAEVTARTRIGSIGSVSRGPPAGPDISQKTSDYSAIPLCSWHHRAGHDSYHQLSERWFAQAHQIHLPEFVQALNSRYRRQVPSPINSFS